MLDFNKCLNKITIRFPWSVIFFALLIISVHFLYQGWDNLQYWPIAVIMNQVNAWSIQLLFNQSNALMNLVGINFYKESNTFFIEATNGSIGWLQIVPACTSIKPWLYWFFIITLVAGSWKHKIWYFPLGILLIQAINAIRIVLLAFVLTYLPGEFYLFHDILGVLVYGTLFLLWVFWVEKIARLAKHSCYCVDSGAYWFFVKLGERNYPVK